MQLQHWNNPNHSCSDLIASHWWRSMAIILEKNWNLVPFDQVTKLNHLYICVVGALHISDKKFRSDSFSPIWHSFINWQIGWISSQTKWDQCGIWYSGTQLMSEVAQYGYVCQPTRKSGRAYLLSASHCQGGSLVHGESSSAHLACGCDKSSNNDTFCNQYSSPGKWVLLSVKPKLVWKNLPFIKNELMLVMVMSFA